MATIADLNVRIGAEFKAFDKAIGTVETKLRRTGRKLNEIGNSLTYNLSIPLLAVGASAIKSAGDMEALRLALTTTMEDAGRTTADATNELELLRKAAMAPGLDFEQAVKGSVRLQNVGFSAEQSRKILIELANAVAMAGGSAQELDSVTRQFGQMIAKGRIMQEDLSIIQENMPGISKAMQQAFGTKSAEDLRKMGINAEQFVEGITKQLATLPRVEGGIKNSIVNAFVALKVAAAEVGEEINKAFDISDASDRFQAALQGAVQWFKNLDDGIKRGIVQAAAFLVAIGPISKALGMIVSVGTGTVQTIRYLGANLKSMSGAVLTAADRFKKMDAVMKATTIGLLVVGVMAAVSAYQALSNQLSATGHAQKELNEVKKSATEQAAQEAAKAEELVRVFKKENATREEKKNAIEALRQINPAYFGDLDIEKSKVEDVEKALAAYKNELIRVATVKQATERIAELKANLADLSDEAKPGVWQTLGNALASGGNATQFLSNQSASAAGNIKSAEEAMNAQIKALEGLIDENMTASDIIADTNKSVDGSTNSFKGAAAAAGKYEDELSAITDRLLAMNEQEQKAQLGAILQPFQSAGPLQPLPTPEIGAMPVISMEDPFESIAPSAEAAGGAIQSLTSKYGEFVNSFRQGGTLMEGTSDAILSSILQLSSQGETSMKDFANAALRSALDFARAEAVKAIFSTVSSALQSVPFPFNLIAAGVAAGGASAIMSGLINKVPQFADGGVVYGPTLGLMGEYSGAASNPEVIAPLDKLQSIMGESGGRVEVYGTIRGSDILLSSERAQRDKKRVYK